VHTRDAGASTAEGHTTGTAAHMDTAKVAATAKMATAATKMAAAAVAPAAVSAAAVSAAAASESLCLDCAHSKGDNRKDNSKLAQHHTLHHGRNGVLVTLCVAGTLLRAERSGRIVNVCGEPVDVRLGSVATVGLLLLHSCSGKYWPAAGAMCTKRRFCWRMGIAVC
jgi:hypothetical protein